MSQEDAVIRALKGLVRVMEGKEARDYMEKIEPEKVKRPPTSLKISMGRPALDPKGSSDEPPDAIRSILSEVCSKEAANA
jgi:hypothetical protein